MQIRKFPSAAQLAQARAAYRDGGLIAYATESCFGLGCDPLNARALRRVIALKGRPNHKGLIVVAASIEQLAPLIKPLSAAERATLLRYWPGPYTFLIPASPKVLPLLRGRHRKIAVRVTAHRETASLCHALGPLVSTSANRAGQKSLRTAAACERAFGAAVLTLPGRVGQRRKPSTIIDLETGRVLR
ncbi:L-threonylcarbamoyladenylate synthase [Craterilacuibacter sp.]|uniref:L-threonylcarbamoyladenylate synthase n=1 Tax=Craterilacuibacter sp. TaxID=2870909 RepID=UPI003F2B5732